MSEEYPLYPTLSEEAKVEAKELMEQFREEMRRVCDNTLNKLYTDVSCYIETDHWTNYRNELLDGLCNYNNRKVHGQYDFKKIREAIYKQFRDDIINDLNQDLLEEIESLKQQLKWRDDVRRYTDHE